MVINRLASQDVTSLYAPPPPRLFANPRYSPPHATQEIAFFFLSQSSTSVFVFGFLLRLSPSAFSCGSILLRLRLVSSGFVLLEEASRSPSSGFVSCSFAIKIAWVMSSSWSLCCPTSSFSSSVPHHPLHPLCSRLGPCCPVPCAADLCLLAQQTWRSSSRCAGVLSWSRAAPKCRAGWPQVALPWRNESWSPVGPISTTQYNSTP